MTTTESNSRQDTPAKPARHPMGLGLSFVVCRHKNSTPGLVMHTGLTPEGKRKRTHL